jgi:hypothetical protein
VLQLTEEIANAYEGVQVIEEKKQQLTKIKGASITTSLIKVLDEPEDPAANAAVGRWLATSEQEWDMALPYLAKGSDAQFAVIAQAELAQKILATEFVAVADQWYDLGKRNSYLKESIWRHALSIYETVRPQLTGLMAAVVDKRLVELVEYLPLGPDTNYDKLTVSQWGKLKGTIIPVDAARHQINTGISLKDGQQLRLVPHPTDTWRISDGRDITIDTTYKGQSMRKNGSVGELACTVGNGKEQQAGIITGIGEIVLYPSLPRGRNIISSGIIRVKILPVGK